MRLFSNKNLASKLRDSRSLAKTDSIDIKGIDNINEVSFSLFDITETEVDAATVFTNKILDDPISDITREESSKFLIPYPNNDMPHWLQVITKPFRQNYVYEPASMMVHLCVERLENEELTNAFGIGDGFNMRAYFISLHIWLLHRRAMKEIPIGILLDRYLFTVYFNLFKDWLQLRKIPEHRFNLELQNCQAFMMKVV